MLMATLDDRRSKADKQIAPRRINEGDEFCLKVGFDPKKRVPAFLPQFEDGDLILGFGRGGSVRIFVPNTPRDLVVGEVWNVRVTDVNVTRSQTKDFRTKVYIRVDVLSREEHYERELDIDAKMFYVLKLSGKRFLGQRNYVVNVLAASRYKTEDGMIISAEVYRVNNRVVGYSMNSVISRERFITNLAGLKRGIDPKSLVKAYNRIPPLPKTELESIMI